MSSRGRAFRRSQTERAKDKARRVWRWTWRSIATVKIGTAWISVGWEEADPGRTGRMASVHSKPCSCSSCGNPRRHGEGLTVQERRSFQKDWEPYDAIHPDREPPHKRGPRNRRSCPLSPCNQARADRYKEIRRQLIEGKGWNEIE